MTGDDWRNDECSPRIRGKWVRREAVEVYKELNAYGAGRGAVRWTDPC